tara:strand:+ start:484 stop:687 length:204 start_codon:yes stop_codon:yes gene_type:complete
MTRTVTIQRSGGPHAQSITVAATWMEGDSIWRITDQLDEDGNDVTLTSTEELLATSLIAAGVDETGR